MVWLPFGTGNGLLQTAHFFISYLQHTNHCQSVVKSPLAPSCKANVWFFLVNICILLIKILFYLSNKKLKFRLLCHHLPYLSSMFTQFCIHKMVSSKGFFYLPLLIKMKDQDCIKIRFPSQFGCRKPIIVIPKSQWKPWRVILVIG